MLKPNEFWHGGGYNGGPPLHSLYVSKDLKAAESYVSMAKDRGVPNAGLKLISVKLLRGAPAHLVEQEARAVGIDNGGNTPASVFDPELHGKDEVRDLVYRLMHKGFDHAAGLEDIGYGIQREFMATVLFRNTNPKLVQSFAGANIMKIGSITRLRELSNRIITDLSHVNTIASTNMESRITEVLSALANQAQAKRFLQNIGLHPTKVGKSEDDYVSFLIARDSQEQDVVNKINEALRATGKKVAKDYGPPIKRITKTLRWVWDVPGKGCMVFFPLTYKIGFMNKPEDIPDSEE